MKKMLAVPLLLAGLSGCISGDHVAQISRMTTAALIHKERCELYNLTKQYPYLKKDKWTVYSVMTLRGTASDYVNPEFTTTDALAAPSTSFVMKAPFSVGQKKEVLFSQSYAISLEDITESSCTYLHKDAPPILGDLGVAALVAEKQGVQNSFAGVTDVKFGLGSTGASGKGDFSGSIEFTVEAKITGLGPLWTLVHFSGPGGLLNVARTDVSKLELAFLGPAQQAVRLPVKATKGGDGKKGEHAQPETGTAFRPLSDSEILKRGNDAIIQLRLLDLNNHLER
ncbi:hypothetical protein [Rhizobium sp. Rhizsp82]|uniref:hypothetical protein n=1 Tax=Rhizobium sp. Rhizsp82 TaxID=3243057 RepID=UPI0039B3E273